MPHLSLADAELYYETFGQGGEPILLIQGVGAVAHGWRPVADLLSGRFRLLSFDNRGIGDSTGGKGPLTVEKMAEDAQSLIQSVGWKSCHVVGHSLGGVIAQRLALQAPHLVRSLTLVCTVSRGAHATKVIGGAGLLALRTRMGTKAKRRAAFLEMIFSKAYLQKCDGEKLAQDMAVLFGRDLASHPPILYKQRIALRKHDCTSELSRLRSIPSLVVSGAEDLIAPPQRGRLLAMQLPGSQFVEIPGAAHGIPLQMPTVLAGLIESFIDRPAANSDRRRSRDRT